MTNEEKFQELAKQLRKPNGIDGMEVAEMMSNTNLFMILHAVNALGISDKDKVLELGHGNCSYLKKLFISYPYLSYYGLEVSKLMQMEASRINEHYVTERKASFHLYDGINIPFEDRFFNKVFTINTIYFWSDIKKMFSELFRVLQPKGILAVTFGEKAFMETLPFTKYDFKLYEEKEVIKHAESIGFKLLQSQMQSEYVTSKSNVSVERFFFTITFRKISS